jgi:two-component sensor histidine kinase
MIKIIMKQDDNKVKLVVSDNGVGLPESLDIAETESLGLQLVHTLSLQLESEIEIQRTNGAAFSFEFTQMEQV